MLRSFIFAGIALAFVGCSGGSEGTLQGTVTLDGKPMTEGVVHLKRIDGKGSTVTAPISNGSFTAKLTNGDWRVEFSLPKMTGKSKMYDTKDSPTVDVTKESIPEKYNVKSEFKVTVTGGTLTETYALTSGK